MVHNKQQTVHQKLTFVPIPNQPNKQNKVNEQQLFNCFCNSVYIHYNPFLEENNTLESVVSYDVYWIYLVYLIYLIILVHIKLSGV